MRARTVMVTTRSDGRNCHTRYLKGSYIPAIVSCAGRCIGWHRACHGSAWFAGLRSFGRQRGFGSRHDFRNQNGCLCDRRAGGRVIGRAPSASRTVLVALDLVHALVALSLPFVTEVWQAYALRAEKAYSVFVMGETCCWPKSRTDTHSTMLERSSMPTT